MIKLIQTCLKCRSSNYYVKTAIFAEKDNLLKIHLGTYYLKICSDCGFTEMYAAEIIDKEKNKNVQPNPEF